MNQHRSRSRVTVLQRIVGAVAGALGVLYGARAVVTSNMRITRQPLLQGGVYLHGFDAVLAGIGLAAFGYAITRFALAPYLRRDAGTHSDWQALLLPGLVAGAALVGLAARVLFVEGPHLHDAPLP